MIVPEEKPMMTGYAPLLRDFRRRGLPAPPMTKSRTNLLTLTTVFLVSTRALAAKAVQSKEWTQARRKSSEGGHE